MKDRPLVTFLLPVRNEERYLPATLRSLQRQTVAAWELIAVDDGSSDATAAILDAAAAHDSRIHVLHRPPSGLVGALNAGLAACRTELVARIDGDDICHPRRLEVQLAAFTANPTLDLVASRVRHFPRPGLHEGMLAYEEWQNSNLTDDAIKRDLWIESPFAHPSVLFRKTTVERVGGYCDRGWAEDYDLWLRLAEGGATFGRVPQTLLYWRDRPERLTRTAANCSLAAFRACKTHYLQRSFLRETREVLLWGAGIEGKAWRQTLAEIGVQVTGWIEVDRRKIGQTIHGAPVISCNDLHAGMGKFLVTIGARIARPQVRDFTAARGLVEGVDYLCVT